MRLRFTFSRGRFRSTNAGLERGGSDGTALALHRSGPRSPGGKGMNLRSYRAGLALGSMITVATLLTGCASNQAQGPSSFVMPAAPQPQGEYVLQPGDAIDITFYYHPENNQQNL